MFLVWWISMIISFQTVLKSPLKMLNNSLLFSYKLPTWWYYSFLFFWKLSSWTSAVFPYVLSTTAPTSLLFVVTLAFVPFEQNKFKKSILTATITEICRQFGCSLVASLVVSEECRPSRPQSQPHEQIGDMFALQTVHTFHFPYQLRWQGGAKQRRISLGEGNVISP